MPTRQAHRVLQARMIIGRAYRDDKAFDPAKAIRYELLGAGDLALVRLKGDGLLVDIRFARRLSSGKLIRLLKENRSDFRSVNEVMRFLERAYLEHGGPNGEPPAPAPDAARSSARLQIVR